MTTHTRPSASARSNSEQAAKPSGRAPRFDQRGIALQTVIIIVVMLAIAGAIAAVLFSRAQEATTELENQSVTGSAYAARTESACNRLGGQWGDWNGDALQLAELRTTNNDATIQGWVNGAPSTATTASFCKP